MLLEKNPDLEKNSNHSKAIRLIGSFAKIWVLGVPVNEMKL